MIFPIFSRDFVESSLVGSGDPDSLLFCLFLAPLSLLQGVPPLWRLPTDTNGPYTTDRVRPLS